MKTESLSTYFEEQNEAGVGHKRMRRDLSARKLDEENEVGMGDNEVRMEENMINSKSLKEAHVPARDQSMRSTKAVKITGDTKDDIREKNEATTTKSAAAANSAAVIATPALEAHSFKMETILSKGFSTITEKLDQALTYAQSLPSINSHLTDIVGSQEKQLQLQSQLKLQLKKLINKSLGGSHIAETGIKHSDGLPSQTLNFKDNSATQLKIIASTALNISKALDGILDRFAVKDYRHPNYSCPNLNRGDYQFVGPKGFYSTCYFLAKNV